jgi:2-polyprenyl-3-methyl-5-hydroxy-6-metoxy-1,4-benzoquinol methylase
VTTGLRDTARGVVIRLRRRRRPGLQSRYDENRVHTPLVEQLSDADLEGLNELLPWQAFTVDSTGRPFGAAAFAGKRTEPQVVPDPRIVAFGERFGLADKHVLEVGCFEGIHTVALAQRAQRVTAIDARIENVVKTIVRSAFFGESPLVAVLDLEDPAGGEHLLEADLCHHVGVLYHLADPVGHLQLLGRTIRRGLMLDTQYTLPEEATEQYEVGGRGYRYRAYREVGRADVFSGMEPVSRWLTLEDIEGVLKEVGFGTVEIVERRDERNGPRVMLFAEKTG